MAADQVARTVTRIAHEIVERHRTLDDLALVGIRTRGVPIARRLSAVLHDITGATVPTGVLDITLYRDDLMRHAVGPQPVLRKTEIEFSIDDRRILLVDDVLYTGRTVRAALDALIDFGRPRSIELVVLVDRGTASSRSSPTMSARICQPRFGRASRSGWKRLRGWMKWC